MKINSQLFISLWFFPFALYGNWLAFVAGEVGYGETSGFVQTPKGGTIGTTSFERPTFKEVDIDNNRFYSLSAGLQYKEYCSEFEYSHLHPHGQASLQQALVTHNRSLPVGSPFNMQTKFDWSALSVGKIFSLGSHFTFVPLLSGNWINYDYTFFSPNADSSRSFTMYATNIGATIQYDWPSLAISLQGETTIPLSNLKINRAVLGIHYRYPITTHATLIPTIKIGALQIDFEDHQPVPNHILYKLQPYGSLGVKILVG